MALKCFVGGGEEPCKLWAEVVQSRQSTNVIMCEITNGIPKKFNHVEGLLGPLPWYRRGSSVLD